MFRRSLILFVVATSTCLHALDWGGERARQISDATEVLIPLLGFASVVLNSDLAHTKHEDPLKINGVDFSRGYVTKRDAKVMGESLLRLACSYAHVAFYKQWVLERRPEYGREHIFFSLPQGTKKESEKKGPTFYSFPSSHSSKMFFGAGTIHNQLGWKAATPFYIAASAASLIRLSRDNHFVHDLVAGAMIGAKFALSNNYTNILPTPMKDGGAVTISFKY